MSPSGQVDKDDNTHDPFIFNANLGETTFSHDHHIENLIKINVKQKFR